MTRRVLLFWMMVFPAQAGVSLKKEYTKETRMGLPRASGGEPLIRTWAIAVTPSSPRKRG